MAHRRSFGTIRKMPSGRYSASYTGPDTRKHFAPTTFDAKIDAEGWLHARRTEMLAGEWRPKPRAVIFEQYATTWLEGRNLTPRTKAHYRSLLRSRLLPAFGSVPLRAISPELVRSWYSTMPRTTPTLRAHSYALLRTILRTAEDEELITSNPCKIRGAGSSKRVKQVRPASLEEIAALVAAMPERLKVMTLVAAWCALRYGELTELRLKDVDLDRGVLHVRRGVSWVDGQPIIGSPKSAAGLRDVAVPPHLLAALQSHVEKLSGSKEALLFPAADGISNLRQSSLAWHFNKARESIGRPDLRWHDLRHTGAVLAAATGATLAELMARLGHSTPGAALTYQHAAAGRDTQIAAAMSKLAEGIG